jgi:hypothetical protein
MIPLVGTSLVKLVPAHHVYLQVLQRVDFSFVRPLVAPFYSAIGRSGRVCEVAYRPALGEHYLPQAFDLIRLMTH